MDEYTTSRSEKKKIATFETAHLKNKREQLEQLCDFFRSTSTPKPSVISSLEREMRLYLQFIFLLDKIQPNWTFL
jgi:hypothetical protein